MLNLKKTAVAVLALGSSAVFAGTMGPVCAPGNVTVPCASQAWDFGVQALYLKPSYSGAQYDPMSVTTIDNSVEGLSVTNTDYEALPNNWAWGFKLEGSYHFSTGNDLNLNWYHLDHTQKNNYTDVAPLLIDGVAPYSYDAVATSANTKWDAVNLEFGQHAHFGEWKNIRFHGGVQYARIQSDFDGVVAGATIDGTEYADVAFAGEEKSKFSGFGPRIGADYLYNWGNGFAMYANGATALLVGTQSFDAAMGAVAYDGDVLTAVDVVAGSGSVTAVVPSVEAKLGVKYTYAMAQGDLSLDAGWMWSTYFNAVSSAGLQDASGTSTIVPEGTSNFSVQGPFVGLKWVGNVA